MQLKPEKLAEIEERLEALTTKAAKTDERIAEVQEEVVRVKERAENAQRRLAKGA